MEMAAFRSRAAGFSCGIEKWLPDISWSLCEH